MYDDVITRHPPPPTLSLSNICCFSVEESQVVLLDSLPLIEYSRVHWRKDCRKNTFSLADIVPGRVLPHVIILDYLFICWFISYSEWATE